MSESGLGLVAGTPVGVGIIDTHAGRLRILGAPLGGEAPTTAALEQRVALIGGTSSCHMAVSRERTARLEYSEVRLAAALRAAGQFLRFRHPEAAVAAERKRSRPLPTPSR